MTETESIKRAATVLEGGGIVAYPTEAVFGLGCDPLREDVVNRLLALKRRPRNMGVILIAADVAQLRPLIDTTDADALARAEATWPGPVTWVFPARPHAPDWITGGRDTLAVRVTDHRVSNALCRAFGRALVSTSANVSGEPPARDAGEVKRVFGAALDFVLDGDLGGLERPTEIRDARSGEILRHG